MPGIQQWSKNVSVTAAPGKRVRLVDASSSAPVGAGGLVSVTIYSPAGYLSQVKAVRVTYPVIAGAASGTTDVQFSQSALIHMGTGSQVFGKALEYNHGSFLVPNNGASPTTEQSQTLIPGLMVFDAVTPLNVILFNNTNAADPGLLKKVFLLVVEEKVI
jgi:hypothetical protein